MTRIIISFFLIIGIGTMGYWSYNLYHQKTALQKELVGINEEVKPLSDENTRLISEIEYLKNPDNLEKQLRSRFNYIEPNEELVLVVP